MRYLGIDYGSKRIGLSVSDEEGVMAFPYKIVDNSQKILDIIYGICKEENIKAIVIGESLNLSGNPNEIMKDIISFQKKLSLKIELPIYLEKEFMTTVEARKQSQFGHSKDINNSRKIAKVKQSKMDASASALILQRYLDKQNQNSH